MDNKNIEIAETLLKSIRHHLKEAIAAYDAAELDVKDGLEANLLCTTLSLASIRLFEIYSKHSCMLLAMQVKGGVAEILKTFPNFLNELAIRDVYATERIKAEDDAETEQFKGLLKDIEIEDEE